MLKAKFRITVGAEASDCEMLDMLTLASLFTSAPARCTVIANHGLPAANADAATSAMDKAANMIDGAKETLDATLGEDWMEHLPRTITGRPITPEALDAYRETFAMRRSFGIANDKRENIDTNEKLPKILAESVDKFFPTSSVEQLKQAAMAQMRGGTNAEDKALAAFPMRTPSLELMMSLLHKPFWDADDEVARHNWKKVVVPQTNATVQALQHDLLRLEVPSNVSPAVKELIRFDRLDLRLDKTVLSIENEATNRFADVSGTMETFYELLNKGAFGERSVVRVDVPFIDYEALEAQLQDEIASQKALEASEEELLESGDAPDAAVDTDETPAEPADSQNDAAEASPEAAEDTEGEKDAAEGALSAEEEEEPPSHYQGLQALRFAEETVSSARLHTFEFNRAREERAAAAQAEAARIEEEGGTVPPSAAATAVWGIISSDGTLEYFDLATRTFCEKPKSVAAPKADSADAEAADDAIEAASAELAEEMSA